MPLNAEICAETVRRLCERTKEDSGMTVSDVVMMSGVYEATASAPIKTKNGTFLDAGASGMNTPEAKDSKRKAGRQRMPTVKSSKAAPTVKTSVIAAKPVRQANYNCEKADEKELTAQSSISLLSAMATLHALYYVLVSITSLGLLAYEQPKENLAKACLKGMQEWGANFNFQDMIGNKMRGCCARAITSALRAWEALRAHHCMSTDILGAILHYCVHPRDAMTKARKKGARAWRHHGKFIFILMLLTMPSSTATRHFEMAGGGGAVVLDDDSLNDANYLIDGKHAVQYGTRFTKTLVHHLEVHGVNAKHESRSGMHRLLDNVL
eukprot:g1735.t1